MSMRAAHIVLASVCLLVVTGPALATCPVADAKVENAIATKPELRGSANVQVVRDLRTLRDAAVVLDAYEHESACKRVVAVLNELFFRNDPFAQTNASSSSRSRRCRRLKWRPRGVARSA